MKVNVQRGLKVRKSTGSQLGDWTILVEWAANLANQISYPHGVEMVMFRLISSTQWFIHRTMVILSMIPYGRAWGTPICPLWA
ncbi:hypothetical protein V6N13_098213 [Hibiscus sabdariffa]